VVKPTDRNHQKEVLQILDHKRKEECHRRSGKENGKYYFKKQLEKITFHRIRTNLHTPRRSSISGKNFTQTLPSKHRKINVCDTSTN